MVNFNPTEISALLGALEFQSFFRKSLSNEMANFVYKMRHHRVMVIVFNILGWISVLTNTTP